MAGLMDMYAAFNAPAVSTGDYANVQQRKNELQNRRFSGLGEIASRNSIEQLQKEYNSKTGRFVGMDDETAFKSYYDALSMIDPARAKQEADMRNQTATLGIKQQTADISRQKAENDQAARLLKLQNGGKDDYLNEIKTLTYAINTTSDLNQKQMLTNQKTAIEKLYLDRFGASGAQPVASTESADTWLSSYFGSIALPDYGVNADGTIRDESRLIADIQTAAKAKGLTVLDAKIKDMVQGKNTDLKRAYEANIGEKVNKLEIAGKTENVRSTGYDNWLKENLPGVETAYKDLNAFRDGLSMALNQANRSDVGGAYIAMKRVLGDAISGSDFAGIAGFGVGDGLIGLVKAKLGGTPMSDSEAKAFLREAINGFSAMKAQYDERFKGEDANMQKARKAYRVNPLVYQGAAPAPSATVTGQKQIGKGQGVTANGTTYKVVSPAPAKGTGKR